MPVDRPPAGTDNPSEPARAAESATQASPVEAKLRRLDSAATRMADSADSGERDAPAPPSGQRVRIDSKLEALDLAAMQGLEPGGLADRPTGMYPPPRESQVEQKLALLDTAADRATPITPGPREIEVADRSELEGDVRRSTDSENEEPSPEAATPLAVGDRISQAADLQTSADAPAEPESPAPSMGPAEFADEPEPERGPVPDLVKPATTVNRIPTAERTEQDPDSPAAEDSADSLRPLDGADSSTTHDPSNPPERPDEGRLNDETAAADEAIVGAATEPPRADPAEISTDVEPSPRIGESAPDQEPIVAGDPAPNPAETDTQIRVTTMSQGEFWSNHPLEYVPPDTAAPKPEVSRQFEHPEDWVKEINPDQRAPGRNNNCGDCARATELTWRGVPAVSAAYAYPESGGESDDRMEEWSRQYLAPASFTAIQEKLEKAGAGSSALVAVGWDGGGGHWFNAVNHGGEVLAVDGQRNTVEKWPPTRSVTGYDESRTVESLAILFDKSGNMI